MSEDLNQRPEFFGVHVLSQPAPRRKVFRTIHKVIVFSAPLDPVLLLAESDTRVAAYMLPRDDDVAISHDRGELQQVKTALNLIPKTLTAPWPITDSTALWGCAPTMAGATSRVLVTEIHATYADR